MTRRRYYRGVCLRCGNKVVRLDPSAGGVAFQPRRCPRDGGHIEVKSSFLRG